LTLKIWTRFSDSETKRLDFEHVETSQKWANLGPLGPLDLERKFGNNWHDKVNIPTVAGYMTDSALA